MPKELNPKQKRFCEEYVVDLNATQAAIRAGYSKKTAYSIGDRLLKDVEVKKCIRKLQKKLSEATQITAEKVILELWRIGSSNIQDMIVEDNAIKDLSKIDRAKAAAISSIKVTERHTETGSQTTTEFKLYDKPAALNMLGKHLGIFERDNEQKKSEVEATVINLGNGTQIKA